MEKIIGVAIGGTKCLVSLAGYDGELHLLNKAGFKTSPYSDKETMDSIFSCIDSFHSDFDFISVICGSPMDNEAGVILGPTHLPGFQHTEITKILEERYGKKAVLLNDADAGALAEYRFGAGRGSRDMVFVTFGTGFGCGFIFHGKLYSGHNGMAGEIGHIRLTEDGPVGYGKKGSIEGWCSGGCIGQWAKDYIQGKETMLSSCDSTSMKNIAMCARKSDPVCQEIIDIVAKKVGDALSFLVDLLNFDTIVLGGIYPRCQDLLEKKIKAEMQKECLPYNLSVCRLVPSSLGEHLDEFASLMGYFNERDKAVK